MENQQQILIETQFEGLMLYVRPDETHEWLMETLLVAEGYGVSESSLRSTKNRHQSELLEGKHFIGVANCNTVGQGGSLKTFWTKRGVIRLGFFIKSERARLFRDWAEDLVIRELEKKEQYMTVEMFQKYQQLQDTKMHQYLDGLYKMMKKESKETRELIHNLSLRVDKLEQYLYQPKLLPEKRASIYLMRKRQTNEYKIGKSTNPIKRAKEFKNGGTDIEIVLIIEFANDATALMWEKTLQITFEHLNLNGEWFILQPCDVEVIIRISEAFEGFYDRK